jgi:myo-inositol-1-phosphate synthase
MDNGLRGALTAPSSYFMKSPPVQYTDDEARRKVEEFVVEMTAPKGESKPAKG